MYTLFNNIVSATIHSVVVCVDFLDIHTANLVLSLKLGVAVISQIYSCILVLELLQFIIHLISPRSLGGLMAKSFNFSSLVLNCRILLAFLKAE